MKSWKIGAVSGLIAGIVFIIVSEIATSITLSMDLWEPWFQELMVNNTLVNIPLFCFWGIAFGVIYSKIHSLIPRKGILRGLIYGLFLFFIERVRMMSGYLMYGQFLGAAGGLVWGIFVWIAFGLSLGFFYQLLHNKYRPEKEEVKIITYPMKSGILPGAIAGLMHGIAGGVGTVIGHVTGKWGIWVGGEIITTIEFWISQFGSHMIFNMIWGIIFGAFFALVYNLVPGKKVMKGLCFGLLMFFITSFQFITWMIVRSANHGAWQLVSIFTLDIFVYGCNFVVFGLVLGYLYRKPSE